MTSNADQSDGDEPNEDVPNEDDMSSAAMDAGGAEQGEGEAPQIGIRDALQILPLFDDLFLRMQALNLEIVDAYMEDLEAELLHEYIEIERTPIQSATFVSALSQLWVFGLYELLRTWRQRASEVLKFAEEVWALSGADREKRIAEQRERITKASEAALDTMYYWKPFDLASRDREFISKVRTAVDSESCCRSDKSLAGRSLHFHVACGPANYFLSAQGRIGPAQTPASRGIERGPIMYRDDLEPTL